MEVIILKKSVPLYRVLYLTENSGEYAITRTKNPHIKEFTRVKQYLNVLKIMLFILVQGKKL